MAGFQPIKVAVLGSCVTRDIFNGMFNPGYKDLFECVALANQVSLVSLMSEPVPVDPEDLNGLEPRVHAELLKEFSRSFLDEIVSTAPDYLIMDFRPDLIFGFSDLHGGGTVTQNTWSITKTRFYEGREAGWYRPDRTPAEFTGRWQKSVDKLFAWLETNAPETKVIIHKARNVATWKARSGETKNFGTWSVSMNRHWDAMDDYITNNHDVQIINVLAPGQTSFEDHPWGPSALHYTFDYHQRFLTRLARMAFENMFTSTMNTQA